VSDDGEGFLSRWSRRKVAVREGKVLPSEPVAAPAALPVVTASPPPAPVAVETAAPERPPAPTLDDVAQLTRSSDYTRFVAPDVDPQVKNAALKKLFTDPQFNVMDGLDVYIDDYGKPDPIPASMLRQMVQSHALGLFDDEKDEPQRRQAVASGAGADPDGPAPAAAATSPTDDPCPPTVAPLNEPDPAVRLQPDDAAGPAGPGPGPGQDAGRER
jgi:hypothetical protein